MNDNPREVDFDGLVVEASNGDRLLALPIAVLEILRYASVIQYRRAGSVHRMRLDGFLDGRQGGRPVTRAQDVVQDHVRQVQEQASNSAASAVSWPPAGSAPTPPYGAPALPVHGALNPSPTPPPEQEPETDPADIPLRMWKDGQWVDIHVTRAQYERYQAEGKISPTAPADRPEGASE